MTSINPRVLKYSAEIETRVLKEILRNHKIPTDYVSLHVFPAQMENAK